MWEYCVVKVKTGGVLTGQVDTAKVETKCNDLGREGWERAGVLAAAEAFGQTREAVLLLKRQKA